MEVQDSMDPAVIGLVGVAIGVLAGLITTVITLLHASRQRRIEREMTLRREVYLQAAEGLAAAQGLITRLGRADLNLENLTGEAAAQGWYVKVQTVASQRTIGEFARGEAFFGQALIGFIPLRVKLDEVSRDLNALEAQLSQLGDYQKALHQGLQGVVSTGAPTELYAQYSAGVAEIQMKIDALRARQASLFSERSVLVRDLTIMSTQVGAEFRMVLAGAIAALREELGLPLPVEILQEAASQAAGSQEDALRKFMNIEKAEVGDGA